MTAGSRKIARQDRNLAQIAFRSRLLHTESFRLAATYAAIFVVSILLFSALVYFTVDAAFRAEALRDRR